MKEIKNNSLRLSDVSSNVTLYGWVQKKRDLGGVCFIDLRDRSGIVQLVAREGEVYDIASGLKSESVLKVNGIVMERESKNPNMETGDIEVELSSIEVLNSSNDLPFESITQCCVTQLCATQTCVYHFFCLSLHREYIKPKRLWLIFQNLLSSVFLSIPSIS